MNVEESYLIQLFQHEQPQSTATSHMTLETPHTLLSIQYIYTNRHVFIAVLI